MDQKPSTGLYPALLKYWRARRGMSQLDLAFASAVSSRHVSFLETGRSQPSREMVHCLASAMDLSMQVKNEMLTAAGFPPAFARSPLEVGALDQAVLTALDLILERHEPFPVLVMDGRFDIVGMNSAAKRFLDIICTDPSRLGDKPNGYEVFLHPDLGRDSICDWPDVAALLVDLLNRKVLQRPDDHELSMVRDQILALPDINRAWRTPELDTPTTGVFTYRFETAEFEGSFLTTLTTFIAPNNITLEELSIESFYPLDDATTQACQRSLG